MIEPEKVVDAITTDFKINKIPFSTAASRLGYSSGQSLSTFLFRKKKQKAFFTEKEALRFERAFGFNKDFLMAGMGELYGNDIVVDLSSVELDKKAQSCLLFIARIMFYIIGDVHATGAWVLLNDGDAESFRYNFNELVKKHNAQKLGALISDRMIDYVARHTKQLIMYNEMLAEELENKPIELNELSPNK